MTGTIVRSTNLNFYLARAKQARDEAEAATLDHVRERCRRSEAAWNVLDVQATGQNACARRTWNGKPPKRPNSMAS